MNFIQPLNLDTLFVGTLAGTLPIFMFLAMIFIAYMAARFRMPNGILLVMIAIFALLFAYYFGGLTITVLIVLGIIGGYLVTRLIKS